VQQHINKKWRQKSEVKSTAQVSCPAQEMRLFLPVDIGQQEAGCRQHQKEKGQISAY